MGGVQVVHPAVAGEGDQRPLGLQAVGGKGEGRGKGFLVKRAVVLGLIHGG